MNAIHPDHLQDLRKSGLSDDMIAAMQVRSISGSALDKIMSSGTPDAEDEPYHPGDCHGAYALPYLSAMGVSLAERYRVFGSDCRYLSCPGADNALYIPPGFDDVLSRHDYVIVTEGEKKAAKAVQEGFPCVAISGVAMWADPESRRIEKHEGRKLTFRSLPLNELCALAATKKMIVMFDSDAKNNYQVAHQRRILKDALLYHCAEWVRTADMPIPSGVPDDDKIGLDDLLCHSTGASLLESAILHEKTRTSMKMTPLIKFAYDEAGNGQHLFYTVPNTSKHDKFRIHHVYRDIEEQDEDGGLVVRTKTIGTTRAWMSRVVRSIDGDNLTLYEISYIPLDSREIKYISGGSDLIRLNRMGEDPLADHGARILTKERPAMEEFFNACQTYGVRTGAVKSVDGTRRRGWLDNIRGTGGLPGYVMAGRVFLMRNQAGKRTFGVFSSESDDVPLLPVDSGSDTMLKDAMVPRGSLEAWRAAIDRHVVPCPIPALIVAAGFAGLLRHWCPDSENFILHLYGESSHGKTTAMYAAASAWGAPDKLVDNWRTTDNGLERRGVARNDMVLFLDEAGMAPSEDVLSNAVYMLGNGGEKMRATRDARDRITTKFKLSVISSGEKQLIRNAKFAGQEVRAIEIRADALGADLWPTFDGKSTEAEAFKTAMLENYGWAVELMVQGILERVSEKRSAMHDEYVFFTNMLREQMPAETPPHIIRRAKHFGLCLLAWKMFLTYAMGYDRDTITTQVGLLGGVIAGNFLRLDTDQFQAGEKGGILQHFLSQMARNQNRFITPNQDAPHGEVYGVVEGGLAYVIPGSLSELMKPYDNARLVQVADSVGVLEYGTRRDKKMSKRIGGMKPDCYVFNMEKIDKLLQSQNASKIASA